MEATNLRTSAGRAALQAELPADVEFNAATAPVKVSDVSRLAVTYDDGLSSSKAANSESALIVSAIPAYRIARLPSNDPTLQD